MDHDETYELTPDPDLDDVIAAYLKAVETGVPPNPQSLITRFPAFAKELGPIESREQDWKEIVRMKLAGTKFRAFADAEDYRRFWSSQMRLMPPSQIL